MHEKDFDKWNKNKKDTHKNKNRPYFHEREVWWCAVGHNVGFEQDGVGEKFLRPVLVLKKFNSQVFWGILLTKTEKDNKYYFHFYINSDEKSVAILSQLRLFDSKRLHYKEGYMDHKDLKEIKKRLKAFLE